MSTIFELRQAVTELQNALVNYATHHMRCNSNLDPHTNHSRLDDRAVCKAYPCDCGLTAILQAIMPTIPMIVEAPTEPQPPQVPLGTITHLRAIRTDPVHTTTLEEGATSTQTKPSIPWCHYDSITDCIMHAHKYQLPPCTRKHKDKDK